MVVASYNALLVKNYKSREVSVSYGETKVFWVENTRFTFRVRPCLDTGQPVLTVQLTYPDGSTEEAEKLVLLIKGLSPCKDTPFDRNGWLSRHVKSFKLSTRLAERNYSKRRMKYNQEKRRIEEINFEIRHITRGGVTIPTGVYDD